MAKRSCSALRASLPVRRATSRCALTTLCGALFLLLAACNEQLNEKECDELLDRYTERLLVEERPGISHIEIGKRQAEARKLAHELPRYEFERCAKDITRSQFECAMNAPNVDSIERCLL